VHSQLPNPLEAPWMWLKRNRNDRGFLATMGFDCVSFDWLAGHFEVKFSQIYARTSAKGRKSILCADDVLALVLHYLSSRAEQNVIGRLFGLTLSSTFRYIWHGMRALHKTLKDLPEALIRFPIVEEMKILSKRLT
jgi:hypothetical protein